MSLDEFDFKRLGLSTKLIKIIQKIQKSFQTDQIIEEEYLENDEDDGAEDFPSEYRETKEDNTAADNHPEGNDDSEPCDESTVEHTDSGNVCQNPYAGITLERVRIFHFFTGFHY